MEGWLGFNDILSTQVVAVSCPREFEFISKANGVDRWQEPQSTEC